VALPLDQVQVVDPPAGIDPDAGRVLEDVEDANIAVAGGGGRLGAAARRVPRISSVAPMFRIQLLPSVSLNMIRLASSGWSARAIRPRRPSTTLRCSRVPQRGCRWNPPGPGPDGNGGGDQNGDGNNS